MLRVCAYLNLHVPFLAIGFLLAPARAYELALSLPMILCAFSGCWCVYLLDRWKFSPEDAVNAPERTEWLARHRTLLTGLILGSVSTFILLCALTVPWELSVRFLVYVPVGILYTLPVLPGNRRLKDIANAKSIIVCVGWMSIPLLLPGISQAEPTVIPLLLFRACWLASNLLWSDWHDRDGDRQQGIRTFVQDWTIDRVHTITRALCLSAMILVPFLPPLIRWEALGVAGFLLLTAFARKRIETVHALRDSFFAVPLILGLVEILRSL